MSTSRKKAVSWAVVNVPFAFVVVYAGLVPDAGWAKNLAGWMTAWLLVLAVLMAALTVVGAFVMSHAFQRHLKTGEEIPEIPRLSLGDESGWYYAMDLGFDTAVTLFMAAVGWYWLASLYFCHTAALFVARRAAKHIHRLRWQQISHAAGIVVE